MNITKEIIKISQRYLVYLKIDIGSIDGVIGKQTRAGWEQVKELPKNWTEKRKIIGCIQLYCKAQNIDAGIIDGYWGPDTENGYQQLCYLLAYGSVPDDWRPEDRLPANPNNWPVQTLKNLEAFYGKAVATGNKNLVTFDIPYPLMIAWNPQQTVTKITAHKKVKDSILRVFNKVLNHYGAAEIERLRLNYYGGCYNYRKVRGGSALSTHSWGIALDFDPEHNQLRWDSSRARFARPEYDKWWQFWEEEGWVSLGRERNYDWMHIQAAKLHS